MEEVRFKALVHSSNPNPTRKDVWKDFHSLQPETVCREQNNSLKSSESQNGDLRLHHNEHVPVVIGLTRQDCVWYSVPRNEGDVCFGSIAYCLDSFSMEVSAVASQAGENSFSKNENQDLVVAPEIFVDKSVYGLFIGTSDVTLQSPRVSHDDVPPHSPLPPPMQKNQIQRNVGGLTSTDVHVSESIRAIIWILILTLLLWLQEFLSFY